MYIKFFNWEAWELKRFQEYEDRMTVPEMLNDEKKEEKQIGVLHKKCPESCSRAFQESKSVSKRPF